jgi:hypothetical protein
VDRVHGAWTGWRGSGPRWTGRGADKRCDGASLVHGVRALRLVEAHQPGGRGGGCEAIGGHTVGEEVVWRWFDDGEGWASAELVARARERVGESSKARGGGVVSVGGVARLLQGVGEGWPG